jgi:hypothetical protein
VKTLRERSADTTSWRSPSVTAETITTADAHSATTPMGHAAAAGRELRARRHASPMRSDASTASATAAAGIAICAEQTAATRAPCCFSKETTPAAASAPATSTAQPGLAQRPMRSSDRSTGHATITAAAQPAATATIAASASASAAISGDRTCDEIRAAPASSTAPVVRAPTATERMRRASRASGRNHARGPARRNRSASCVTPRRAPAERSSSWAIPTTRPSVRTTPVQ